MKVDEEFYQRYIAVEEQEASRQARHKWLAILAAVIGFAAFFGALAYFTGAV
jgi:hypothetical protein